MYATSSCRRSPSPATLHDTPIEATTEPEDLENFPWSELNTPANAIQHIKRRPVLQIQARCNQRLAALDAASHKTEGLKLFINGIKTIKQQEWQILLIYFDETSGCPNRERLWSHVEWRKWDVVELFVKMALAYNAACVKAAKDSVTLLTEDVDREFLALMNYVLQLGAASRGTEIAIREWEREGTMVTMDWPGLCTEDVDVKGEKGG